MAYLTPEKEVDLMLEFSRIKTELIDLHEKESDYPTLSIAEVKQIEKYKQVRVAVSNVLDLHKGKAFPPKTIDEPYIESVDYHLTEERLEQIIDYATNISAIVKDVLGSGGKKLKKDHMKWLQTFFEKAWSAEKNAPVRTYNKEIIEDIKHLHSEEETSNEIKKMLKENVASSELETHNLGADVAVRQGLYGTELPEGDIDLKQYRLFHTMDTYSWHNGLPQPVLQGMASGMLHVINGDIEVGTCQYTKCENLIRLSSKGGSRRRFCSSLHRNYQFRELKKPERLKTSNA